MKKEGLNVQGFIFVSIFMVSLFEINTLMITQDDLSLTVVAGKENKA